MQWYVDFLSFVYHEGNVVVQDAQNLSIVGRYPERLACSVLLSAAIPHRVGPTSQNAQGPKTAAWVPPGLRLLSYKLHSAALCPMQSCQRRLKQSSFLQDVPSMPERYNSLPRLKLEPKEDPMQHGGAPMSAPARSAGLVDLAGASPHPPCRSTGVHAAWPADLLGQDMLVRGVGGSTTDRGAARKLRPWLRCVD